MHVCLPHLPPASLPITCCRKYSYNVSLCKCLLVLSSLPFIKHQTQPTLGKITERKGRKKRTATSPVTEHLTLKNRGKKKKKNTEMRSPKENNKQTKNK